MRPLLFDFKRTFLGKYTLISFLVIILLAAGAALLITSSVLKPKAGLDLAQQSFSEFGGISGTLVPILASLSSYFYYGKDKANDVLESVMTLPVTRGRLIISRFVANVSSMLLAFAIGVGIFELILFEQIGEYLSLYYVSYLIWVYLVEISACTGLVYLASQYLKSQAAILGFTIALFVVFGIFWERDIPYLVMYFAGIPVGSFSYTHYQLIFDLVSPAGYPNFADFLIAPSSISGTVYTAAQFGVTPISVGLLGLGWTILPILAAFQIGRKRD